MTAAVEMKGITKSFPGVLANDHIDFTVNKSEIRGLLGENGAGKTVLMNILYGLYSSDEGEIYLDGHKIKINSPAVAINNGIGMVHQHFMLVPSLTVIENIILGNEATTQMRLLDNATIMNRVSEFCKLYNLQIDLTAPVHTLSVGVQQRVEILKALYRGADILILDEPTAILTPPEVDELFNAIRALKSEGKTVIFISHKLKEVLTICDSITVLRKGKVIRTVEASKTNQTELANMMVGRRISTDFHKTRQLSQQVMFQADNITALNDRKFTALNGINIEIYSSEILGLAGVEGNGQTEFIEVIMGLRKMASGTIVLDSEDITSMSTQERIKLGISHIPEDRRKRGLIPDFSVMENLILGSQSEPQFTKWGFSLNSEATAKYSNALIKDYNIDTPNKDATSRFLSGGNQQRLVVAREFSRKPKFIIAAQPTRGLDVAGIEYVHRKLIEMRNQGAAILLISADLDEIWALSDRIAVLYEGRIVAIKKPDETDEQELGVLMTGGEV